MKRRHPDGIELELLRSAFIGALAAERERAGRSKLSPSENAVAFDRALDALTRGHRPQARIEGDRVVPWWAGRKVDAGASP